MSIELNKTKTLAGITYNSLHWWLRKKYGTAIKCENQACLNKSKYFVWALKKRKKYDRKRENFWQLCRKCHIQYDMTPKWKKNFFELGHLAGNKARLGTHHSLETRDKIKRALKSKFPNGRKVWNKGKQWNEETRKKMSLARMGKIPWNKGLKLK